MPKQLWMRLVMQRNGAALGSAANHEASAMSLGASVCCSSLLLCLHLLDFLICFSFVQLPHNERSMLSWVSQGKTVAVQFDVSSIWVAFISS